MSSTEKDNWKKYTKGKGVIVSIPGDEHQGVQSRRPGIILSSHPNYITVQLLSSQPSNHDLGSVTIVGRKQYIRPIYLKHATINQVKGFWFDYTKRIPIKVNDDSKLMNIIESNSYKVCSITLKLDEFLELNEFKNKFENILLLTEKNDNLKKEMREFKERLNMNKKRQRTR